MCKVLIVDDEEPVREAIMLLGKWKELGINRVIEAQNGKAALQVVEDEHPDIILVDMKMPELNGAEFLKIIAKKHPDISSIVISGYDEFSFTKQAIKSKVIDYLLKPINRDELNNALKSAVDVIASREKSKDKIIENNIALNVSIPVVREKVFMSIIEGNYSEEELELYKKIINAHESNYYGITILRIGNLEYVKKAQHFNNNIDLLNFAINNVVQEFYFDRLKCFGFRNPKFEREIVIVTYSDIYNDEIVQIAYDSISKVVRKLKEVLNIISVAAIGDIYSTSLKLGDAYKSAKNILDSYNIINPAEIICRSEDKKRQRYNYTLMNIINIIKSAVENGSYRYIKNELEKFLTEIKKAEYLSINNADRIIDELIFIMKNIFHEFTDENKDHDENTSNSIESKFDELDYTNFSEFETLLYRISEYMYQKIRQNIRSNQTFNIQDIKKYIDNNYYEDIKVSMFTEKYYLSREYLMKLFKQEFGYGIYEYVQKIRMEKAQELLGDLDVKIQSISKIIGYRDNNYFSKAFRRYFGISPSAYRNMLIEKRMHNLEEK
ncbi:response regulator transcription factor [Clostridium oryzae]|uniref:Stage 0 sporulation protein A homolog n=1 Tax=Clostridium oryzae TaxID=1450648 RepID=A0A1V4II50_9CLOT|nr:response regulator [Clostridium oryzae]OPJ59504.1 putative response regulatory protein [Clostridium oryzae]